MKVQRDIDAEEGLARILSDYQMGPEVKWSERDERQHSELRHLARSLFRRIPGLHALIAYPLRPCGTRRTRTR